MKITRALTISLSLKKRFLVFIKKKIPLVSTLITRILFTLKIFFNLSSIYILKRSIKNDSFSKNLSSIEKSVLQYKFPYMYVAGRKTRNREGNPSKRTRPEINRWIHEPLCSTHSRGGIRSFFLLSLSFIFF